MLSLPDRAAPVDRAVAELWDDFQIVDDAAGLAFMKKKPAVAAALEPLDDDEVLDAIHERQRGKGVDRPVKQVELDALLGAPEGLGDEAAVDADFHARRLPSAAWRRSARSGGIASVIQLHRLREVQALVGFTRFEAVTPDIHGEYDTDVERAAIALDPEWFPAVENRGEGVFVQLRTDAVQAWRRRPAVARRLADLSRGHDAWIESRKTPGGRPARPFPGGPYVLLHTLSHLADTVAGPCAAAIPRAPSASASTPSPARPASASASSSTPAPPTPRAPSAASCSRPGPSKTISPTRRAPARSARTTPSAPTTRRPAAWRGGGCTAPRATAARSSRRRRAEMRNDYLDRALVVPVLGLEDAAFFPRAG